MTTESQHGEPLGDTRPRVVVVGGGYAGVNVARSLGDRVAVTIVSDDNFLLSTPMLAEVAAGDLDPRHIVTPIRELCPHAALLQGDVVEVDVADRRVTVRPPMGVAEVTVEGDALVLALGAVPADFGVEGVAEHSLPFKSIQDALRIRNRILALLEAATVSDNPRLTSIAVVGAGYSGAELAASLADFVHDAVDRFFPTAPRPRVTLIDAVDRVTPALDERLSAAAARQLEERRVTMHLGTEVTAIDVEGVVFADGDRVEAGTVIWSAGVRPNPLTEQFGLETDKGRIVVDGRMCAGDGVFALGDIAAVPDGSGGISPPTAQFAVRQAAYLGKHLPDMLAGSTVPMFRYRTKGELVSLGYRNAVGRVLGVPVSGIVAWFLWRSYYLLQVPSTFRRARIALDWTLDLIFPPDVARIPSTDLGPPV